MVMTRRQYQPRVLPPSAAAAAVEYLDLLRAHDLASREHSERVASLCRMLALEAGLGAEEVTLVHYAAALHDVGKLFTPLTILLKTGSLNATEREQMRAHSIDGATLLAASPLLVPLANIVRAHHERFDGTGYPDQLAGAAIPRAARLIAVTDAFDAMTSARSYRSRLEARDALEEIERCSGSQFDPEIVTLLTTVAAKRSFSQIVAAARDAFPRRRSAFLSRPENV